MSNLIVDANELVVGQLYMFEFRKDYDLNIKLKYKYYIYNGFKQLDNGAEFYEFMPQIKKYQKPVLAVFNNSHFYKYGNSPNEHTMNYKFAALGYLDYVTEMFKTYNIYDLVSGKEPYGLDEVCLNIYKV